MFTVNVELLSLEVTQIKNQGYIWSNEQFVKSGSIRNVKGYPIFILEITKKPGSVLFINRCILTYILLVITFEKPYVKYNLWFLYLIKHLPLYEDFVFQLIIKYSRYFLYVSKLLRGEYHSQSIALIYLIANAWRNGRSEILLIEKVFAWTIKRLFSPCSILDIHNYFLEVTRFCII